MSASFPIPPKVEKTTGVKDAFSFWMTRSLYSLFFSFSCLSYSLFSGLSAYDGQFGWKIRTSMKVLSKGAQSPIADTSSLALLVLLLSISISSLQGIRDGSITISFKFQIQIRIDMYPPFLQDKAWSILFLCPH